MYFGGEVPKLIFQHLSLVEVATTLHIATQFNPWVESAAFLTF